MNFFRFATLILFYLLSGCVSQEGFRLPSGATPSKSEAEDFSKRNAPVGQLPESKVTQTDKGSGVAAPGSEGKDAPSSSQNNPTVLSGGPRIIVIGNVMALKAFDEETLNARYDNYEKQLAKNGKKATFTREWYLKTSAGTVAVKIGGIPGVFSRFYTVEVPKDLASKINFASGFGTFMIGASADLVAAELDPSLGNWLTRILCSEKSADFMECESRFNTGLFQSSDGREIDSGSLKVKDSGATIDLKTYEKRK